MSKMMPQGPSIGRGRPSRNIEAAASDMGDEEARRQYVRQRAREVSRWVAKKKAETKPIGLSYIEARKTC